MSPETPLIQPWADCVSTPAEAIGDPTTSMEWCALWQRHFGTARDLCVNTGETQLPLTFEQRKGARVWRSFTNGHSQRSLTAAPNDDAAPMILDQIKSRGGWDMLHLQGLHPDWAKAFCDAAKALGLEARIEHETTQHHADLGEAAQDYRDRLEGRGFKRLAKSERALNRLMPVTFHQDPPAAAIDAYLLAEQRSWKATQGELLTHDQATTGFYRDLAQLSGTRLFTLRAEDKILAGFLSYGHANHSVCLKTFYDAAFQKYSLGSLLIRNVLLSLMDQGFSGRVDFYSDRSGFARFATGHARYVDLVIWANHPRAQALRLLRNMLHHRRQGGGA